jgi:cyclic pyranopterin phosphate synthase
MNRLRHIDQNGKVSALDISNRPSVTYEAEAIGFMHLKPDAVRQIKENEEGKKGNVLKYAETCGVKAAKRTRKLVPLVNDRNFIKIEVKAYVYPNGVEVKSFVSAIGQSGVEIESLTAVSISLLTLYEICKTVDPSLIISDLKILRRTND